MVQCFSHWVKCEPRLGGRAGAGPGNPFPLFNSLHRMGLLRGPGLGGQGLGLGWGACSPYSIVCIGWASCANRGCGELGLGLGGGVCSPTCAVQKFKL